MKTTKISTLTLTAAALLAASFAIAQMSGLPFLFAIWLAAGVITLAFGGTVVATSIVSRSRAPLALHRSGAVSLVRAITRPSRVAA